MTEFIPVNEPLIDAGARERVLECLETGWISSEGEFVAAFERGVANRVGRRHGVAVSSGTAALDIAVAALGIGPGDEVILPAFTIISCVSAVLRAGAQPVLVDCDPQTWNLDVRALADCVTPQTRAVMPVHIYGLPVDMEPLLDLAREHGLRVIEDAAEAIGLDYRDRPCGSFGDISTFSFYANKHVTTGEGGMLLTDDNALADRCRSLRNLCFQPERRFVHEALGWNYRMTNLQAALGLSQLDSLDRHTEIKRAMGARYDGLLGGLPVQLPLVKTAYARNVYWVYGLVLDEDVAMDAAACMAALGERGVGTRPFFWPLHEQPVLRRAGLFEGQRFPVAERIARRGFYLPSGLALSDAQLERVAAAVHATLG